jgi:hypothetical protein
VINWAAERPPISFMANKGCRREADRGSADPEGGDHGGARSQMLLSSKISVPPPPVHNPFGNPQKGLGQSLRSRAEEMALKLASQVAPQRRSPGTIAAALACAMPATAEYLATFARSPRR